MIYYLKDLLKFYLFYRDIQCQINRNIMRVGKINCLFQFSKGKIVYTLAGIEFADPKVYGVSSSFDCGEKGFLAAYRNQNFRWNTIEIWIRHIISSVLASSLKFLKLQ